MKIFIIGGTGHVGAFLSKILTERGHEVVVGSRGVLPTTNECKHVIFDATKDEDIEKLKKDNYDTVVMFTGRTAHRVYEILNDSINHLVLCGSLWMYGVAEIVPTPEITFERPCFDAGYRFRYEHLLNMIKEQKCKVTAIMPPNICGPGKVPIDCLLGRDVETHRAHQRGELVYLPDGPQGLLMPTDAYDIAMLFALACENPDKCAGEIFNVGTEKSLTATEFVKTYAKIYKTEIPIEYVAWQKYVDEISPSIGHWWHLYTAMCPDISKAVNLLGYKPKYTCEDTLERAVKWMYDNKIL